MRQVETPDNRTLTYEYDDNGRVTRTLDDAGRDTLTEYDALGRVVRRFGPVHDAIDADDPLTILSNARRVTEFERDTLGNVTGIRAGHADAAGLVQQLRLIAIYPYDDFGNVLTETDAPAKITHYVYDRHALWPALKTRTSSRKYSSMSMRSHRDQCRPGCQRAGRPRRSGCSVSSGMDGVGCADVVRPGWATACLAETGVVLSERRRSGTDGGCRFGQKRGLLRV